MFKIPPKTFGKFKKVERENYQVLKDVLLPLLPRSRRIVETLNLSLNDSLGRCFFKHEYFLVTTMLNTSNLIFKNVTIEKFENDFLPKIGMTRMV